MSMHSTVLERETEMERRERGSEGERWRRERGSERKRDGDGREGLKERD